VEKFSTHFTFVETSITTKNEIFGKHYVT